MLLTHRDDVADHAVLRGVSVRAGPARTRQVGGHRGRRTLARGHRPRPLDADWVAIPVPGHTRGSVAYLYRETFLFSGDHLWADEEGELSASRSVCWFSWPEQVRSLARLLDFRFEWVLPGHGRRLFARSAEAMRGKLEKLVHRLGH